MVVYGRRAFTLIELLVVIAIIALLMGVLVPALQRARKQGKEVACRSNLRQIGVGAQLYAEEWDQLVPRGAAGNVAWYVLFMPFLAQTPTGGDYRSVNIYRCPGYPDKEQTVCFVVNGWDFQDRNDTVGTEILKPTSLSACSKRAFTLYLVDNEDGPWRHIVTRASDPGINRCDVWNPGHLPSSDSHDITRGRRVARARHRKGTNCLYVDWHVGWMAADNMTVDDWRFEN